MVIRSSHNKYTSAKFIIHHIHVYILRTLYDHININDIKHNVL